MQETPQCLEGTAARCAECEIPNASLDGNCDRLIFEAAFVFPPSRCMPEPKEHVSMTHVSMTQFPSDNEESTKLREILELAGRQQAKRIAKFRRASLRTFLSTALLLREGARIQ